MAEVEVVVVSLVVAVVVVMLGVMRAVAAAEQPTCPLWEMPMDLLAADLPRENLLILTGELRAKAELTIQQELRVEYTYEFFDDKK
jgi:hypothetical protein